MFSSAGTVQVDFSSFWLKVHFEGLSPTLVSFSEKRNRPFDQCILWKRGNIFSVWPVSMTVWQQMGRRKEISFPNTWVAEEGGRGSSFLGWGMVAMGDSSEHWHESQAQLERCVWENTMNSYSYVGRKWPRPGLLCLKWNQNLKSREFPAVQWLRSMLHWKGHRFDPWSGNKDPTSQATRSTNKAKNPTTKKEKTPQISPNLKSKEQCW